MTTGCEASTHSPAQPWPEVRQGSQVHSCQECLSPIISSKFAAKWRAWVILMQPRPSPCRDSVQDSCWESFHGYIWVADLRINPFCCTLGTSADTTLLIVAVGKRRRRVTGAWATALFRVLWCRFHAGSHSSSTVHLHLRGYLHLLMFRHDIHRHVLQPTHTSAQMFPLTATAEAHTRWGSRWREVTCVLDEISLILKGNSNHIAFVKSAQGIDMMTEAIGNWCWVQRNKPRRH